jgi:hypothetical protein
MIAMATETAVPQPGTKSPSLSTTLLGMGACSGTILIVVLAITAACLPALRLLPRRAPAEGGQSRGA